jgi:hypothetical protein
MLEPAVKQGKVELWHDRKIPTGAKWEQEIEMAIQSAGVAVLLVSTEFLNSSFIGKKELPQLLENAKLEGVTIFWICVAPCLHEETEINQYQAAHDVKKPLDSFPNRPQLLKEICARLIEAVEEATKRFGVGRQVAPTYAPIPPPSPAQVQAPAIIRAASAAESTGNAYGLAIGISRYRLADRLNLRHAADDAEAFADLLEQQSFYQDHVPRLLDEEATLPNIMDEFEKLSQECAARDDNPLVVIYFSGHGAADSQGRNYLIPHDGNPDRLFSTALWNKTLNSALDEIKTDRLVVFLDACHTGAIAAEGTMAAALQRYDTTTLRQAFEAETRRCLVASCGPQEFSYELKDHCLFTQHLLALMRGDDEAFEDVEEIELQRLYASLRRRVSDAAKENNLVQNPWATEATLASPIVLAHNMRLQERRFQHERLESIHICIKELQREYAKNAPIIRTVISQYLADRKVRENMTQFCELIDSIFAADHEGNDREDAINISYEYSKYLKKSSGSGSLSSMRFNTPTPRSGPPSNEPAPKKGSGGDDTFKGTA